MNSPIFTLGTNIVPIIAKEWLKEKYLAIS